MENTPSEFANDHDAITTLVAEFRAYTRQDMVDKAAIRADIKELREGLVNRVDVVERGKISITDFMIHKTDTATHIQTIKTELEKQLTRLETTVYGENDDGVGGLVKRLANVTSTVKWVMWFLGPVITFIIYLMINHIMGSK